MPWPKGKKRPERERPIPEDKKVDIANVEVLITRERAKQVHDGMAVVMTLLDTRAYREDDNRDAWYFYVKPGEAAILKQLGLTR